MKYQCETCGSAYKTEYEALECEKEHDKCLCLKCSTFTIGDILISVFGKTMRVVAPLVYGARCVSINYCPLCGRKL